MIQEEIKKIILKTIKKEFLGRRSFNEGGGVLKLPVILVEPPKEKTHGDYATNIAFALANLVKKKPSEIALTLKTELEKNTLFSKVEVVGGFVNFFLVNEVFQKNLALILKQQENFGKNDSLKNKKVIVEYTDPNILKEFHIGHLMSNTIGESLSRIIEFAGAKVKRACYQSDVGLGTAKAVWGKLKHPGMSWQEAYVLGTQKYDEDAEAKKEIIELNKQIFQRSDAKVNKIYDEGKKWSLSCFETIYKKLGTTFDYYFFESQVAGFGKEIVQENIGNVFAKGDNGAIIFKGEDVGLHTRVFINSEGLPTYEAKELGLAKVKYATYKYDSSVVITGNEINEYFKVLLAAMSQIFPKLAEKTKHVGHGMMRLPEGKMSSRTGKVVTAESLLANLEALVNEKIADRELSLKEKKQIAQSVAVAAVKYSVLKQSAGSDIIYDPQRSVTFEGDSGPYLQYSLARALSVLVKAKTEKIKPSLKKTPEAISVLAKKMYYFSDVVERAGKELQPHYIALYLIELAGEFNHYYAGNKIVDKTSEFSPYHAALTEAFSVIMKNGLWLLGINYLQKM